jgi:hypothetical protein
LRGHVFSFQSCVEVGFCLGWRDTPDGLEQAAVDEPVDPFQRGIFDGLEAAPWAATMNDFCLLEAVDRLGQGIVIAVTNTADRWFDAGFAQPFGVANG